MLILHYRFFPNALSQCIVLRLCLFLKITRLFYIPNYRAFGVLMWEIFTSGFIPYPGLQNNDVMTFVRKGGRLEIPAICPQSMYVLHRPLRDSISGHFFSLFGVPFAFNLQIWKQQVLNMFLHGITRLYIHVILLCLNFTDMI